MKPKTIQDNPTTPEENSQINPPHHEHACHCGCGCGCNCDCGRKGGKFIIILLAFLAGIGLSELLHGNFGRCPYKADCAKQMMHASHHAVPHYTDGAGTVIIINTNGQPDIKHLTKGFHGKHHHNAAKHHQHKNMPQKHQHSNMSQEHRNLPHSAADSATK